MRVNMLRYTIARESPSDVFASDAGGTYQLGDFDCIADPVTLIALLDLSAVVLPPLWR